MITLEQLKKLKPGDPLVIHGEYIRQHSDGDIVIKCNMTRGGILATDSKYLHPSCVSLPPEKPKCDPCREFRRGDIVRVVGYKGRLTGYDNKTYKVCEDEEESGRYIKLSQDGCSGYVTVDAAYLEIVTPVEELEPYKLIDSPNTYNIVRNKETVMTIHKKSHPHAKLAAEAERDRLNEEWLALACCSEEGKEEA